MSQNLTLSYRSQKIDVEVVYIFSEKYHILLVDEASSLDQIKLTKNQLEFDRKNLIFAAWFLHLSSNGYKASSNIWKSQKNDDNDNQMLLFIFQITSKC